MYLEEKQRMLINDSIEHIPFPSSIVYNKVTKEENYLFIGESHRVVNRFSSWEIYKSIRLWTEFSEILQSGVDELRPYHVLSVMFL